MPSFASWSTTFLLQGTTSLESKCRKFAIRAEEAIDAQRQIYAEEARKLQDTVNDFQDAEEFKDPELCNQRGFEIEFHKRFVLAITPLKTM